MRGTPSSVAVAISYVALFFGGAALGLVLADAMAPGSWIANAISFFALPVAFASSLQAWYGLALVGLLSQLLRGVFRRTLPPNTVPRAAARLSGSWVFPPISMATSTAAGLVAGLVSPTQPVWVVAPIYGLVGTLYGLVAWRLAHAGLLLPPEAV